MANAGSIEATCRIVQNRILKLDTGANGKPVNFNGLVLIDEDKLLIIDRNACNLQIYNNRDGKLISRYDRLKSKPMDVCILSKTKVAVCLWDGKIEILSLKSIHDVKRIKTLYVRRTGIRFECHSIAKWKSDKLLVSGRKFKEDIKLCWCVVSIKDEKLESIHDICEVTGLGETHLAIKDNALYISCWTFESITIGVYAFDIFNPHKPKFLYQHHELETPWSIMTDRDYVYVCDWNSNRIHQLAHSGQLVTIHRVSTRIDGIFYDDQHGVLYTTSYEHNEISLYKMEYPHQAGIPIEILKMDDKSIHLFEEALNDGKETVYNIRVVVVGHKGVGKTTLVKRLLGENVNISEGYCTEGIDVYSNCCDVSLSTHEWKRRSKDSEQDYKLQHLVKVLNENYQTKGRAVDSEPDESSNQRERTEGNIMTHDADDDKNTEVLYCRSQQQNMGQNLSCTSSLQRESSSTVVQNSLTQSETKIMPGSKVVENASTENYKTNPLRNMFKLLQQNPDKAKQDVPKYANLTMLDFAGQFTFYSTHQIFLTSRAIYLLVSDSSRDMNDLVEDEFYFDSQGMQICKVHDLVDVWMNSIHSCAPPDTESLNSSSSHTSSYKVIPPPVILVGTHIDQIPLNRHGIVAKVVHQLRQSVSTVLARHVYCRKHGQSFLKEIHSYLRDKPTIVHLVDKVFAIDNTVVDSELEKLKEKIVEVASQQPYWGEQIPTRWFLLEQQLMRLKDAGMKVISRITVEDLNKKGTVQIKESDELDLFLKYLHETGTIIYFSIEVLRDNIVLDPKWLIDALKSLINAQPNLPINPADNDTGSNSSADSAALSDIRQKWSDFRKKGILTLDIVDAIWTKKKHPELYAHKSHILRIMEQLNIFAKPRSFNETGEKVENYFLTPCMLHHESPTYVISPEKDPSRVTTPEMCCIFTGKYVPTPIFHRLIAACVAHWPVAKKESENLIFCGCCVFDLDLFHRVTVYIKSHVVCAKISRLVNDEIKTPDAKLCSKVRRFITENLDKITSYLGQNLKYVLQAEFQTWHADEGHDPDVTITHEHMNHSRLCVALVTVCGNAMRDVLRTKVRFPHTDINQAILANKSMLTGRQGIPLLNSNQIQLVFPDPQGKTAGNVDHFDLSLLYILIQNISAVPAPITKWGNDPKDQPRDKSLGASVERMYSYRNHIIGDSVDGKINQQDFNNYWKKIEYVLDDIGQALGKQEYRKKQLESLKNQVISVFEAC